MDVDGVNDWFRRKVYDQRRAIKSFTDRELLELRTEISLVQQQVHDAMEQVRSSSMDRMLAWGGLAIGFAGPATLLSWLSFLSAPLAFAGFGISGYQFLRDRERKHATEWCEARMIDLRRMQKTVDGEIARRVSVA